MGRVLKDDEGVLVTLENGLVKKVVRGLNTTALYKRVSADVIVAREIRALERLRGIDGIQRFARREDPNTFYSSYMRGVALGDVPERVPGTYFDSLKALIRRCEERGVFRVGLNKADFIVREGFHPGVVDFGNVLFWDDRVLPGTFAIARLYTFLRIRDLRRRYT